MLGWALIINNLGRRRYPTYWWAAGKTFVAATPPVTEEEKGDDLRDVEAGLRLTKGDEQNGSEENSEGNSASANDKQAESLAHDVAH